MNTVCVNVSKRGGCCIGRWTYVIDRFYKKVTNSCDTWIMRYAEREIPRGDSEKEGE